MNAPLLQVRDLQVDIRSRNGSVRAVDGVSLELATGETLGIVGESGSGKTTLLRAILGLLPASATISAGEVLLGGRDLLGLSARELSRIRGKRIAMVFQEPMTALNPVMRVGDQISEAARAHLPLGRRDARRRAVDLMRQVGIPDSARRAGAYPHELSGGLRQRVVIAMALAAEPEILLCDEPTTALDVTVQDQILLLLRSISEAMGLAMLYVTHDLAVVAQVCDRLAVMYAAELVETGPVDELLRAARHPYTRGLLRALPEGANAQRRLEAIPGAPPDLAALPDGCRFRTRCPFAQADCAAGRFPLRELTATRATACIHHDSLWPDPREAVHGAA